MYEYDEEDVYPEEGGGHDVVAEVVGVVVVQVGAGVGVEPVGVVVAGEFEGEQVGGRRLRLVRQFVSAADSVQARVGSWDFARVQAGSVFGRR